LIGIGFPWGGPFAGAKAHFDLAHPDILARFQFQISRIAVSLIEQSQYRHPFCHRGAKRLFSRNNQCVLAGFGLFQRSLFWRVVFSRIVVASSKR
jgi:hypothetical protein